PGGFDCGDLALQDRAALRVLIAKVNVDLPRLDDPRSDQDALDHAVRIGFDKVAVLKSAGLALVSVDRQQPGPRLLQHQTPLSAGGKPGAAEPAQPGMFENFDQLFGLALACETGLEEAIAAGGAVSLKT